MNRFTFVLPSENQNAFRLLSICANAVYNVIQSLNRQGHLVGQFFCKDVHDSLKYVDEFFELKNDEIQKEHASLSLSLSLSLFTCRSIESTQSVVQKPTHTIKWVNKCRHRPVPCADPEGGQGVRTPPPEKSQNNEFLSNRPDPLKFSKLSSQHSTLGHHRHASKTPCKGVSLAGR